ncbi:MAG: methyltransferase domain-containing protein [Burkholderiales bacterium]|nr:methyltransferase domain-containing protein [Burkholderiales bacterium]
MTVFGSLPPAEQARQLANPEGRVGLEVAEWLNGNNRDGNARTLAMLGVQAGDRVLEIGFGNGRAAPDIVAQAEDVRYAGIDISPTMVAEAARFNAALLAAGRASFHLAAAERMPFEDAAFDRVFSTGVIHFWREALVPLGEIRRVLRPGGLAVLGALDARCPPPFARPELGFFLRSADEWAELCREAGFGTVHARTIESEQLTPDGTPAKRYAVRVTAQR